jgi:hypothetical protein
MGEYSKRIGEIGEEIITDFLKVIGWSNPRLNFDIPSVNPDKHGKKTNGIDGYFHYKSPMISDTIENIIFSVKFSNDKYRNNPVTQFKDHYKDLAMAIESFKKSEIRNSALNSHSNVESVFDRGILFWINNQVDDKINLSHRLLKIDIPKDFTHDGIILMDNLRMEFIFDSINYVQNKYQDSDIQYTYFTTGMNNDDTNKRSGNILPVQYLTSNILPFRVHNNATNEVTLVLCTNDNFENDELMKLMGLSKNIGNNLQTKTHILFPDYNKSNHEQIVETVKQAFNDSTFVSALTIGNFNTTFRG